MAELLFISTKCQAIWFTLWMKGAIWFRFFIHNIKTIHMSFIDCQGKSTIFMKFQPKFVRRLLIAQRKSVCNQGAKLLPIVHKKYFRSKKVLEYFLLAKIIFAPALFLYDKWKHARCQDKGKYGIDTSRLPEKHNLSPRMILCLASGGFGIQTLGSRGKKHT